MSCFEFLMDDNTGKLLFRGLRVWTNKQDQLIQDLFEYFMAKKGRLDTYFITANSYYDAIPYYVYDELLKHKLGLSFYDGSGNIMSKNADLIHPDGYAVARLNPEEMFKFMQKYKAREQMTPKQMVEAVSQNIDDIEATTLNAYDPEVVAKYGLDIAPGHYKFAPDLSDLVHHIDGKPMEIKIKMTGARANDDRLAIKMIEEKYGITIDPKDFENTHVWHHLDDFNLETGECTLQLVTKGLHNDLIGKHIGAVRLWENFFGIKYK